MFSAHDETGNDLRRRWDDPDLTLVGDHPVVNAGLGSHGGAYLAGEYLTTFEAPAFHGLLRLFRTISRTLLPPADEEELARRVAHRIALRDERRRLDARRSEPATAAGPHDHLRHRRLPSTQAPRGRRRLLAVWAAVSPPDLDADRRGVAPSQRLRGDRVLGVNNLRKLTHD